MLLGLHAPMTRITSHTNRSKLEILSPKKRVIPSLWHYQKKPRYSRENNQHWKEWLLYTLLIRGSDKLNLIILPSAFFSPVVFLPFSRELIIGNRLTDSILFASSWFQLRIFSLLVPASSLQGPLKSYHIVLPNRIYHSQRPFPPNPRLMNLETWQMSGRMSAAGSGCPNDSFWK